MINLEGLFAPIGKLSRRTLPCAARARLSYLFSRLRAVIIGPFGSAVLCETSNGKLLIPSSDFVLGRALAFRGSYNASELAALSKVMRSGSEVLFVGAHIGALLIPIARRARAVVGIEANPETFELLRFNLKLNDVENAQVFNFVAGDETREVEFMSNAHNTGGSKIKTARNSSQPIFTYDSPATIKLPMRRLDDVLGGRSFDVIVMDIEGSEPTALAGMRRLIAEANALMLEIHSDSYDGATGAEESLMPFVKGFDQACIIEERQNRERVWRRDEFPDLIEEVINRGFANVLFRKEKPEAPCEGSHD